jgi:FixJ family two-component response regulator
MHRHRPADAGNRGVELVRRVKGLGAVDFLEKPFDDEAVLAPVRSVFSQYEQNATREARHSEIRGWPAHLSDAEGEQPPVTACWTVNGCLEISAIKGCRGSLEKPTVAVVDDDPAIWTSLKFSLELEGFSVGTFA